jgi:hypothetical protein
VLELNWEAREGVPSLLSLLIHQLIFHLSLSCYASNPKTQIIGIPGWKVRKLPTNIFFKDLGEGYGKIV